MVTVSHYTGEDGVLWWALAGFACTNSAYRMKNGTIATIWMEFGNRPRSVDVPIRTHSHTPTMGMKVHRYKIQVLSTQRSRVRNGWFFSRQLSENDDSRVVDVHRLALGNLRRPPRGRRKSQKEAAATGGGSLAVRRGSRSFGTPAKVGSNR